MKKIKTRNQILENNIAYYALLIFLVAIAIASAVSIKNYVGYAGAYLADDPATITTVTFGGQVDVIRWHGLFGLTFVESGFNETQSATIQGGQVTSKIFVFECIDPNQASQEIYATLNDSIDFNTIRAGTPDMVDKLYHNVSLGVGLDTDTAANAFIHNISILLGTRNVSNIPAVFTYINDEPDPNNSTFYTGILNDSDNLVFVIGLQVPSTTGFKGTNIRFQALLPVNNLSETYYFFPDPNDNCPPNLGIGVIGTAYIAGYVRESNSTQVIVNATVAAGGNSTLTDENGYFNLTVPGTSNYNLITTAPGFLLNVTLVSAINGNTSFQNVTMSRFYGYSGRNGSISGYVKDNSSNMPLANATVYVGGYLITTNATGNYSIDVEEGSHVIAATHTTYLEHVGNFSVTVGQNLSYIINLTQIDIGSVPVNGTPFENGTITGIITDNLTNATLQNVQVNVRGGVNFSDQNGSYLVNTYEGEGNLVATLPGYEAYYKEVTIPALNITYLNFSMQRVTVFPGLNNGTVIGVVRNTDNQVLDGVYVSVAGKSNETNASGNYIINNTPPGTHNIIAVLENYENFFTEINITENNVTYLNITMQPLEDVGFGPGQGPGLGAGDGAGLGAGLGPGNGPGTAVEPQVEDPREIPDFKVSVKDIIKKIEEGNFINVPITITSFIDDSLSVRFSLDGAVEPLIRIDQNRATLDGKESMDLLLTILGNRNPGVYDGFLVMEGDIEERIPLYVLITEKDRLDVENLVIKIVPDKRKATLGGKFKYRLDLQNLLVDERYDVNLTYRLESINGNVSRIVGKDGFEIFTSFTLFKSFTLPTDIPSGDYRLVVQAKYLGITSEYATIFEARLPFYKFLIFGILPVWMLFIIVLVLALIAAILWWWKKKKDSKKRYNIKIDYSQIPKDGPRSAFVGLIAETTKKTYFDLDQMQTHTLVAGSTGSGKSVASQGIVEEALLKGTSVMVFDPTVQWTGFLSRCQDKKFLSLYPQFGLKKSDARAFNGNIHQVLDAREQIEFNKYLKPSEINVFVVNKLETRDYETFVSNVIRGIFHNNMPESKQLRLVLVFDEFHRLLPKYGGTGQVLIQIERAAREFRKWGVGLVLISQVISDFQPEVLANINTQLQMRTKDEGDLNRTKNEYGEEYLQSLVKAAVGAGMVENSSYNKGKPYFVQFRPLLHNTGRVSDEDLENYNKYNRIIDDLDYQLEQLGKEGVDIFDLQLELKLALDKVKAGSFNMVDIYLEGLKPRVQQQWDKIGKQPQKKKLNLISETELSAELEKAKAMQQKAKDSEKKEGESSDADAQNAIEKAKDAKEQQSPENKENASEEENNDNNNNSSNEGNNNSGNTSQESVGDGSLDSLLNEINQTTEKPKLIAAYKTLQALYKSASQENKLQIIKACNLIKTKIA